MPNNIYNQLNGNQGNNPMIERIKQFRNGFSGDPKQIIQNMVNTGRISQSQLNYRSMLPETLLLICSIISITLLS